MATSATQFQQWFIQWVADMKKLVDETETWFANEASKAPSHDFTTDQSNLATQRTNLESTLQTLQAE